MNTNTSTIKSRAEVPEKETWNLTDLFVSDADFEKELHTLKEDITTVTQYKGKLADDAMTLLSCLRAVERFQQRMMTVATYAVTLKASADGTDPNNQRDAAKTQSIFASISAELSFIETELLSIPEETIHTFLKEKEELCIYKKMIQDILEQKPFTLSPELEETLATLNEVHEAPYMIYQRSKSSDMIFDSIFDKEGNEHPMSFALYEDRYELSSNTDLRRQANKSFTKTLNQYKNTYAATYATEVTKQVKIAKLRNYHSVTDMLLKEQQVTEDMYHNQLDVIQKELAPHMRKYAKLKQKQLGLNKMLFSDLQAPLISSFQPKTTYEEATTIIQNALKIMGPEYSNVIQKAINERWIDYANNKGKSTGAFCASPYGVHPYILMTWTDTMRGAFVLAHELGHAGHFYLAGKNQSFVNTRPSTYFVEAPSTLNELLLADHLIKEANDKQMKQWVIDQLLGTYYHNFVTHLLEGEFQRRIYKLAEEGVPLTSDILTQQKKEALENFWGDAVEIDDHAGLTWMRQPHYYMGLYPYTYSAGLTVSTAVAQMIKEEGEPAIKRWLHVLKAGGTLKPLDLIKEAGIDMSKPDTIKKAVAYVGSLINELENSFN